MKRLKDARLAKYCIQSFTDSPALSYETSKYERQTSSTKDCPHAKEKTTSTLSHIASTSFNCTIDCW